MKRLIIVFILFVGASGMLNAENKTPMDVSFDKIKAGFIEGNGYFSVPALFVFDKNGNFYKAYFGKDVVSLEQKVDISLSYRTNPLVELKNEIPALKFLEANQLSYVVITSDICAVCKTILNDFFKVARPTLESSENMVFLNMSSSL